MIFPVNLEVLSQMFDPAREKCDLHVRAAGIFVMQLELLKIHRLVAVSHNEGPILAEEPVFATAQLIITSGDRLPLPVLIRDEATGTRPESCGSLGC